MPTKPHDEPGDETAAPAYSELQNSPGREGSPSIILSIAGEGGGYSIEWDGHDATPQFRRASESSADYPWCASIALAMENINSHWPWLHPIKISPRFCDEISELWHARVKQLGRREGSQHSWKVAFKRGGLSEGGLQNEPFTSDASLHNALLDEVDDAPLRKATYEMAKANGLSESALKLLE